MDLLEMKVDEEQSDLWKILKVNEMIRNEILTKNQIDERKVEWQRQFQGHFPIICQ